MKTVWRYELELTDDQTRKMPCGAEPLHVAWRNGGVELWMLVDSDEKTTSERQVRIRGTGHRIDFDLNSFQYVGTVLDGSVPGFVWHMWVEK